MGRGGQAAWDKIPPKIQFFKCSTEKHNKTKFQIDAILSRSLKATKLQDVRLMIPCDSDDLDANDWNEFKWYEFNQLIDEAKCVIPNLDEELY